MSQYPKMGKKRSKKNKKDIEQNEDEQSEYIIIDFSKWMAALNDDQQFGFK